MPEYLSPYDLWLDDLNQPLATLDTIDLPLPVSLHSGYLMLRHREENPTAYTLEPIDDIPVYRHQRSNLLALDAGITGDIDARQVTKSIIEDQEPVHLTGSELLVAARSVHKISKLYLAGNGISVNGRSLPRYFKSAREFDILLRKIKYERAISVA